MATSRREQRQQSPTFVRTECQTFAANVSKELEQLRGLTEYLNDTTDTNAREFVATELVQVEARLRRALRNFGNNLSI